MQHHTLPNTKQECEDCKDKPNTMSWLESRDGTLERWLSLKCCPQLQPGVSILHAAVKCSAWDEFPRGHLASGASQDITPATTATHLPRFLGGQDKGTTQWDSSVQLGQLRYRRNFS